MEDVKNNEEASKDKKKAWVRPRVQHRVPVEHTRAGQNGGGERCGSGSLILYRT